MTLNVSLTKLRATDEVPYPAAVARRRQAGHGLLGGLPGAGRQATRPACRPPSSARSCAAGTRFAGVTITDALEAGALSAFGTTGQRAVTAAGAGMDLILCSARDASQGEAATAALASALGSGQLDAAAFNAAVNRVTALRAGLS